MGREYRGGWMWTGTHQHRSTVAWSQAIDQRKDVGSLQGGQRRVRRPYLTPGENRLPSAESYFHSIKLSTHSSSPRVIQFFWYTKVSLCFPGWVQWLFKGTIIAHCSLELLDSSSPRASAGTNSSKFRRPYDLSHMCF
ncbi:uncharacterized protein [Chlorocebus sabaeus]|uniref:uncharacterized protein isoform X2 n=1 Tax=Chlorocebus sabaeus TaxID=60711 RepID=UPI003BF950CA